MCRLVPSACGLAAVLVTAAPQAQAAGFAIREQSATAQGNAFAGATAAAEDLSYTFFNPATLGRLDGVQAQAVTSWIAPEARLESSAASGGAGNVLDGRTRKGDIARDGVVPALYAMAPIGDFRFGLAINAPFALATDYPDGWVGRYHGRESEVASTAIAPTLAWRANDWVSLGGGVVAQRVRGTLTNAVDFGTIGAASAIPGSVPGAQDGGAKLSGDDWAFGYTAGLLVEPLQGTKLGVAYRSEIEHTLRGNGRFRDDDAGIAATLRATTGAFAESDASVDLTTPASLSLGVHQAVTDTVALMAEVALTDWSTFDEIRVEFDNAAQPDSETEQRWDDSWFFALGATWQALETLTLRTGLAYDQSPVNDRYRTPRIPDADRTWWSLGLGWQPTSWLSLDAAYSHVWVEDSEVDLRASDPGNATRGDLEARYDNAIDMVAISARLAF